MASIPKRWWLVILLVGWLVGFRLIACQCQTKCVPIHLVDLVIHMHKYTHSYIHTFSSILIHFLIFEQASEREKDDSRETRRQLNFVRLPDHKWKIIHTFSQTRFVSVYLSSIYITQLIPIFFWRMIHSTSRGQRPHTTHRCAGSLMVIVEHKIYDH